MKNYPYDDNCSSTKEIIEALFGAQHALPNQLRENAMKISDNEKTTDFEFVLDDADKAIARMAMQEHVEYLAHVNARDQKSLSRLANPISFGDR